MLELGLLVLAVVVLGGSAVAGVNKVSEKITQSQDSFTKWDAYFRQAIGDTYWTWLKAIAMNESRLGDEESVAYGIDHPEDVEGSKSSDGKSWGLMQMTIPTARDYDPLASAVRLNNPIYSINLASKFLLHLIQRFDGVEEYAIKAYNQGEGNTKKEIAGTGGGFADSYWDRYQRNKKIVLDALEG